jgi:hypothetical protein
MAKPFEKVNIRLYAGDAAEMQRLHPEVGYNRAIRDIVHRYLSAIKAREAHVLDRSGHVELSPDDLASLSILDPSPAKEPTNGG